MKRESTSILDYLKAIAWVVVPFCLLGSLHYLFVFFPRTVYEKDNHILFNHLGFDYFGIVVGFFTLLITFLVGWQIFSTIRAKEGLREMQQEYKERFDDKMKNLDDKIEEINQQLQVMNGDMKEVKGENNIISRAQEMFANINRDIDVQNTKLYEWLWRFIKEETSVTDVLIEYRKIKETNPDRVTYIDSREASEREVISLYYKLRPLKLTALKYKD